MQHEELYMHFVFRK